MSVDVFGRQLIEKKEVQRGPPGIGFVLTPESQFDIQNKRLCNVADAIELTDAVTLNNLKAIQEQIKNLKESHDNLIKVIEIFKDQTKQNLLKKFEELEHLIDNKTVYVKDFHLKGE